MVQKLYSVGYQGIKVDDLYAAIRHLDAVLVDVRIRPWSQQEEYQKPQLQALFGPHYQHIPELGNLNYKGGEVLLQDVEHGTVELLKVLRDSPAVVMCACWNYETCHRRNVVDEMVARYFVEVFHLSKQSVRVFADKFNNKGDQKPVQPTLF
ncbi:MAG: hypothetical protein OHK0046_47350 [Anaerolineae bacterium]